MMATVTSIVDAMLTEIAKLDDVDETSKDSWLPSATAQKVACLALPLDQQSSMEFADLSGTELRDTLTLRFEFWVRIIRGQEADCFERARETPKNAAIKITVADGANYFLSPETPFTAEADDAIVELGNAGAFLPVRLFVTVYNDLTVS